MARKKKVELMELVGPAAFYVGLVIALVTAFVTPRWELFAALGAIGVIVGLLNITAREVTPFLLASVAFIIAALGMQSLIPAAGVAVKVELTRLAANLTTLVGASAMVVAMRGIYEAAKGK